MPAYKKQLKRGIRWYFRVSYIGRIYRSKAIYLTKQEALKRERKVVEEADELLRNPEKAKESSLTLLQIVNERLDYIQVKKSKNYYVNNKRYCKILLDLFGNIPINEIKKVDIIKMLIDTAREYKEKGKDNYTANAMLRAYKALFNYAINTYELDYKNPCNNIPLFSIELEMKYIPSETEINEVLKICDNEQRLLVNFVSETAARINECLNIFGKDVYDEYVILYTRKSKNSNLVPRKVPKPDCIRNVQIKLDEKLFSKWDDYPKFLERKIVQLNKSKKMHSDWNWHNLRHRRASIWSKNGKPIFEIMSLLGHSQIQTTQLYLQLLP